jgi:hypothetical protein
LDSNVDLQEIEQDVAHIGQVFKRYTPIGVVGAVTPVRRQNRIEL